MPGLVIASQIASAASFLFVSSHRLHELRRHQLDGVTKSLLPRLAMRAATGRTYFQSMGDAHAKKSGLSGGVMQRLKCLS